MFDIFPRALASVASVLFPIFASYKALQTADPAQLTPWLMYWVVLACVVLIESWTDWLLVWIPFYHYFRLFGLLYLVLPQTQGARVLYQTQIHPWLQHHEGRIDELIGSAHERARSAGMAYLRRAIAYARAALGLPEAAPEAAAAAGTSAGTPSAAAASYTQALLSRFSLPSARWPGGAGIPDGSTATAGGGSGGGSGGGASPGIYSLFSGAIDRALNAAASGSGAPSATAPDPAQRDMLRDRLRSLLTALDRTDVLSSGSGSGESDEAGELRKSRSEPDFVRIDADSDGEDEDGLRRRVPQTAAAAAAGDSGGSWMPWGWGGGSNTAAEGPGTSYGAGK